MKRAAGVAAVVAATPFIIVGMAVGFAGVSLFAGVLSAIAYLDEVRR